MTENEKEIRILRHMKNLITVRTFEEEALKTAIQALEEIQQYRAIGTIEEFKALKEKNLVKKPIWYGHHFCPNCDSIVYVNGGKDIYCPKCGQKLDWSE